MIVDCIQKTIYIVNAYQDFVNNFFTENSLKHSLRKQLKPDIRRTGTPAANTPCRVA